ncbi:serine O-acetyltransferase [Lichenihabitans sp. Uapishka_5]|uniref:serine O-acetyltransferase n=1 Tax=Lichenihabitans sp. Uapishka_5 TaxID=3037302 RepID=UPI0029E8096E|nr:serine O-acetyltransferase [Lichenihabitans sp. Uapishka_5]MDX7949657.1 serine O-acetyltransferase [Lichenihabitans sp. Uapishka_5]
MHAVTAKVIDFAAIDPVFSRIRIEADDMVRTEPRLAGFVFSNILNHATLAQAVIYRVATRLGHEDLPTALLQQTFGDVLAGHPGIAEAISTDIMAVFDRDPACTRLIEPILYFKGFHAIQAHRLAHALWANGRRDLALYLQSRSSSVFQTDIHPAVPFGKGIFLDHATGLVVGATTTIDDNVSLLQNVTLGGTGKEQGDRHPKIRKGVLIGAGAKVLGNIEIGHCSRVAAGSVVLAAVPPNKTVAGVPARIVGEAGCAEPARSMDQIIAQKTADRAEQGF